jgi:hypothetical protein
MGHARPTSRVFLWVPHRLKRGIGPVQMSCEAVTLTKSAHESPGGRILLAEGYLPVKKAVGGFHEAAVIPSAKPEDKPSRLRRPGVRDWGSVEYLSGDKSRSGFAGSRTLL